MGQVGSRGGKDPRIGHVEVGNHQWDHELVGVSGSLDDPHHSNHGEVGFCHDNHHGEGYIHGKVHDGHSHQQDRIDEGQGNGNELGHGEHPVESLRSVSCQ